MKISLRHGWCEFDDEDWPVIEPWFWWSQIHTDGRAHPRTYAGGRPRADANGSDMILMHRLIMGLGKFRDDPVYVDHIDGDGLNNRRENLRIVSHPQNLANTGGRGGSSEFKGVSWNPEKKRWAAQITVDGQHRVIGRYLTEEQAALAYNLAACEAWGEHARLNDIDPGVVLPPPRQYSSQYRGVSFIAKYGRWRANIKIDGRLIYLGQHKTEVEAALAYNAGATRLLGDKAKLNEVAP